MDENRLADLEERNIENLVWFYEEELRRIANGERVTHVFAPREKSKLRHAGVLRYFHPNWWITERANKYLEDI